MDSGGEGTGSAFVREERVTGLPSERLPEDGTGSEVAYDLLTNELLLDGSARLNLATFVTTRMPARAGLLMASTADKNMIDKDEYPQTAEIERRCVNIVGRLWSVPGDGDVVGTSTTGSSEAAMLGGLSLKWRWRERMAAAGKPTDKPNLVTGTNVQVCWEKFCRYWDVEPRLAPMESDRFHLDGPSAVELCDENTIGVVSVLGSTFDGSYEPVEGISEALDELAASGGPDVPMHVDAASGGFVAPFCQPDLLWDFRLPRVQSINASGHKYGLVYPGVGWAVWRDAAALPRDLVFDVNYLGGHMPTFALNFSRPGSEVVAQYYMFVSLGASGYRAVQGASSQIAQHMAAEISRMGPYRLITEARDLPVFAFTLNKDVENYTVFDVSARLREGGWLVPAYTFPPNREDLSVLRVVVRAGFTHDMADLFIEALRKQTAALEALEEPLMQRDPSEVEAFKH